MMSKRETEVESLAAIYPDECIYKGKKKGESTIQMFIPAVFGRESYSSATLLIRLPKDYPSIMYFFDFVDYV